jgi:hypothetical protein
MEAVCFVKVGFLAIFCSFSHFLATQSSTFSGGFVPLDFWHFFAFNRDS